MKHVLLSAFIGSANLGDQAIFSAITQQLEKDKDIAVAAFTLDRKKHKYTKTVRFIQTHYPFRIIGEIYRCDLLVIGGGGIIQDETTVYNLFRHTYKALIAFCLGRKYMLYAVGISRLKSPINRVLGSFILQHAEAVTVRDAQSQRNAQSLGITREVSVTADPAINLDVRKKHDRAFINEAYIVVCLRHWFDINRYIPVAFLQKFHLRSRDNQHKYEMFTKTIASFFDWVVTTYGLKVVFLPFFDKRDGRVHASVLRQMEQARSTTNITKHVSVKEAISLIANAQCTIGMRLHALIFSAHRHTPFIALNYSQKVANFLKELSLEEYGIDLEKLTLQQLKYRFKKLYIHRRKIQIILKEKTQILQEREDKNNQILRQILFSV